MISNHKNIKNDLFDKNKLPQHLAIIMDGNGRWAEKRGLPRSVGHREGAKAVKRVIANCINFNIPILTLFAFSTENWKRPKNEVMYLLKLFERVLSKEKANLIKNNIKINFIGRLNDLPNSLNEKINELFESTKKNNKLILNIAINYGGRAEIIDALKSITLKILEKKLNIEEINENTISDNLYTHNLPDPDLLIRTAGEMRISNFMIWQIAYAELWVTPVFWPDFDKNNLIEAIRNFQKRVRKYGGKIQ
ncbi:MAG: isoprenyl transferase [Candidatus Atribacteria bacterium]|nr:isoprenyl transferase [Candidatus Atribacteria bacterium]MBE3093375.1 isoprenyl transferase [Chloroflexota bacterium]